jgi:hypothetical protein
MILSQPGFWLIIAGALLVAFGFLGHAFSQMDEQVDHSRQRQAPTPFALPNFLSADAEIEAGKRGASNSNSRARPRVWKHSGINSQSGYQA